MSRCLAFVILPLLAICGDKVKYSTLDGTPVYEDTGQLDKIMKNSGSIADRFDLKGLFGDDYGTQENLGENKASLWDQSHEPGNHFLTGLFGIAPEGRDIWKFGSGISDINNLDEEVTLSEFSEPQHGLLSTTTSAPTKPSYASTAAAFAAAAAAEHQRGAAAREERNSTTRSSGKLPSGSQRGQRFGSRDEALTKTAAVNLKGAKGASDNRVAPSVQKSPMLTAMEGMTGTGRPVVSGGGSEISSKEGGLLVAANEQAATTEPPCPPLPLASCPPLPLAPRPEFRDVAFKAAGADTVPIPSSLDGLREALRSGQYVSVEKRPYTEAPPARRHGAGGPAPSKKGAHGNLSQLIVGYCQGLMNVLADSAVAALIAAQTAASDTASVGKKRPQPEDPFVKVKSVVEEFTAKTEVNPALLAGKTRFQDFLDTMIDMAVDLENSGWGVADAIPSVSCLSEDFVLRIAKKQAIERLDSESKKWRQKQAADNVLAKERERKEKAEARLAAAKAKSASSTQDMVSEGKSEAGESEAGISAQSEAGISQSDRASIQGDNASIQGEKPGDSSAPSVTVKSEEDMSSDDGDLISEAGSDKSSLSQQASRNDSPGGQVFGDRSRTETSSLNLQVSSSRFQDSENEKSSETKPAAPSRVAPKCVELPPRELTPFMFVVSVKLANLDRDFDSFLWDREQATSYLPGAQGFQYIASGMKLAGFDLAKFTSVLREYVLETDESLAGLECSLSHALTDFAAIRAGLGHQTTRPGMLSVEAVEQRAMAKAVEVESPQKPSGSSKKSKKASSTSPDKSASASHKKSNAKSIDSSESDDSVTLHANNRQDGYVVSINNVPSSAMDSLADHFKAARELLDYYNAFLKSTGLNAKSVPFVIGEVSVEVISYHFEMKLWRARIDPTSVHKVDFEISPYTMDHARFVSHMTSQKVGSLSAQAERIKQRLPSLYNVIPVCKRELRMYFQNLQVATSRRNCLDTLAPSYSAFIISGLVGEAKAYARIAGNHCERLMLDALYSPRLGFARYETQASVMGLQRLFAVTGAPYSIGLLNTLHGLTNLRADSLMVRVEHPMTYRKDDQSPTTRMPRIGSIPTTYRTIADVRYGTSANNVLGGAAGQIKAPSSVTQVTDLTFVDIFAAAPVGVDLVAGPKSHGFVEVPFPTPSQQHDRERFRLSAYMIPQSNVRSASPTQLVYSYTVAEKVANAVLAAMEKARAAEPAYSVSGVHMGSMDSPVLGFVSVSTIRIVVDAIRDLLATAGYSHPTEFPFVEGLIYVTQDRNGMSTLLGRIGTVPGPMSNEALSSSAGTGIAVWLNYWQGRAMHSHFASMRDSQHDEAMEKGMMVVDALRSAFSSSSKKAGDDPSEKAVGGAGSEGDLKSGEDDLKSGEGDLVSSEGVIDSREGIVGSSETSDTEKMAAIVDSSTALPNSSSDFPNSSSAFPNSSSSRLDSSILPDSLFSALPGSSLPRTRIGHRWTLPERGYVPDLSDYPELAPFADEIASSMVTGESWELVGRKVTSLHAKLFELGVVLSEIRTRKSTSRDANGLLDGKKDEWVRLLNVMSKLLRTMHPMTAWHAIATMHAPYFETRAGDSTVLSFSTESGLEVKDGDWALDSVDRSINIGAIQVELGPRSLAEKYSDPSKAQTGDLEQLANAARLARATFRQAAEFASFNLFSRSYLRHTKEFFTEPAPPVFQAYYALIDYGVYQADPATGKYTAVVTHQFKGVALADVGPVMALVRTHLDRKGVDNGYPNYTTGFTQFTSLDWYLGTVLAELIKSLGIDNVAQALLEDPNLAQPTRFGAPPVPTEQSRATEQQSRATEQQSRETEQRPIGSSSANADPDLNNTPAITPASGTTQQPVTPQSWNRFSIPTPPNTSGFPCTVQGGTIPAKSIGIQIFRVDVKPDVPNAAGSSHRLAKLFAQQAESTSTKDYAAGFLAAVGRTETFNELFTMRFVPFKGQATIADVKFLCPVPVARGT